MTFHIFWINLLINLTNIGLNDSHSIEDFHWSITFPWLHCVQLIFSLSLSYHTGLSPFAFLTIPGTFCHRMRLPGFPCVGAFSLQMVSSTNYLKTTQWGLLHSQYFKVRIFFLSLTIPLHSWHLFLSSALFLSLSNILNNLLIIIYCPFSGPITLFHSIHSKYLLRWGGGYSVKICKLNI